MDDSDFDRFESFIEKTDECWNWKGSKTRGGYGQIRFNCKLELAHRFMWLICYGEIPEGLLVRHKCRNKCVNPEHLELGTYQDNHLDQFRDGTIKTKLTESQVRDIRRRSNEKHRVLAEEFGVSKQIIDNIITRHTWNHI
jgi:hypothetical protein